MIRSASTSARSGLGPGTPDRDLIVAPATPPGRSALAVVRFSGAGLPGRLADVVRPMGGSLPSGCVRRVSLHDVDGRFDDGLAVFTAGPATYTGEDTLEVSLHGNPLLVERLVHASLAAGARLARPGEFTRLAVANGKLDLIRAEATDQLARATSSEGLRVGRAGLDGDVHRALEPLRGALIEVAAELEARLDYPGDELALVDDRALVERLDAVAARASDLAETERRGRLVVEGARVALVGAVNAGKSSLFNALLGRRRALVHETPGTTRDVLEARVRLEGDVGDALEVTLLDTAGERATDDPVEAAGLALARELIAEVDLLVIVLRAREHGPDDAEREILARTADRRRIVVYNGIDRPDVAAPPEASVPASARTGHGLPALRVALRRALIGDAPTPDVTIASARQRDLLLAVADAATEASRALIVAGPAVAADQVVRGLEELDAVTGADTREDVLDALFARFCIGK